MAQHRQHNSKLLIALFQTLGNLNCIRIMYEVAEGIVRNVKN